MKSFEKSAYVGYTATPFANIYIDPDVDHAELGADLFPDSFIRTLPSPTNYLGPERVFGLQVDNDDEEDVPPLPLVRPVDDAESWIPSKHKSSFVPSDDLPRSLREAIASFVLASAARRVRGQTKVHNSMLVHVTRFTAVQGIVRDQVASTADSARYGLASAPGTRISRCSPSPRPTTRTAQVRLSRPQVNVVGAKEPGVNRL
ncbi:Z1 domain-containing protein [Streptomyces rubradiris]|uniref:Z1 domain-containing protein n=1 Tax=Streptomyces rubradiris TaxID=285531 RepID=UPI0036E71AB0